MNVTRRTVIGAAWSVPVIMAAVAVPLAAASIAPARMPLTCTRLTGQGQPLYQVAFNDGSTRTYSNSEINSDKALQALCRGKGLIS